MSDEGWTGFWWGVGVVLTLCFVVTTGICLFFYRISKKDKEELHKDNKAAHAGATPSLDEAESSDAVTGAGDL